MVLCLSHKAQCLLVFCPSLASSLLQNTLHLCQQHHSMYKSIFGVRLIHWAFPWYLTFSIGLIALLFFIPFLFGVGNDTNMHPAEQHGDVRSVVDSSHPHVLLMQRVTKSAGTIKLVSLTTTTHID